MSDEGAVCLLKCAKFILLSEFDFSNPLKLGHDRPTLIGEGNEAFLIIKA